jgi:predicted acylesterase/phospholipase RssA
MPSAPRGSASTRTRSSLSRSLHHCAVGLSLLLTLYAPRSPAQSCPEHGTALVLSGGGAKALVHIGVLEVMDSLGIRPDLIVGTSMGAIVGALYASGYSGRQIDSLAKSLPLSDIFRSFEPMAPRSLEFLQPLLYWEQGEHGFNLQRSAASTAEANAITNNIALRGNLLARGNFDSLPIPFRAVATNLADRSLVVIGTGDLAHALRASYSIPLIFPPEKIGGKLLGDGGLVANVPVGVARGLGATRIIVSDATAGVSDSVGLDAPLALASHLVAFLFHQPGDSLRAGDALVRGDLTGFADFEVSVRELDRLIDVGRTAARTALSAGECVATSPAARPLPRHLTGFHVQGPSNGARSELRSLLGFAHADTVNASSLAKRLRRLASSERFAAVWLNPSGSGDSVSFDLSVRRQSPRTGGIGLAYDQELGGRAWLGYSDHRLLGMSVEGNAVARIGTFRDELLLALRGNQLLDRQLLNPLVSINLAHEDIRRFDPDGNTLPTMSTRELDAFAGYEHEYQNRWWLQGGLTAASWHDSTRSSAGAAGVSAELYQVDRRGNRLLDLGAEWTTVFRTVKANLTWPIALGSLLVTPRLRYGWGEDLSSQRSYVLGGDEGFPGLHIGERRGDRETYASTLITHRVLGPLVARVELAIGATATGGAVVPRTGWLAGARTGLGVDTPVGPIRAEYGYNSVHRGTVFIRVGRWF